MEKTQHRSAFRYLFLVYGFLWNGSVINDCEGRLDASFDWIETSSLQDGYTNERDGRRKKTEFNDTDVTIINCSSIEI